MTTQPSPAKDPVKRLSALPWILVALFIIAILVTGTLRNPQFWISADVRGDLLMREHHYAEAARTYTDPARIAAAQYRDGQFEAAARTYARLPGAIGAYNQATAWLMRGKYDDAIAWYDRALKNQPAWREAEENRALAVARKALLDASSKYRSDEQTNDNSEPEPPDAIAFDLKGEDAKKAQSTQVNDGNFSEDQLRALWLRRVQTTPGDFLRFKFAYQAHEAAKENK